MKHKVKSHRWHAGRLRVSEMSFNTLEEAHAYAKTCFGAESVKIYTEEGELVDSLVAVIANTYA